MRDIGAYSATPTDAHQGEGESLPCPFWKIKCPVQTDLEPFVTLAYSEPCYIQNSVTRAYSEPCHIQNSVTLAYSEPCHIQNFGIPADLLTFTEEPCLFRHIRHI